MDEIKVQLEQILQIQKTILNDNKELKDGVHDLTSRVEAIELQRHRSRSEENTELGRTTPPETSTEQPPPHQQHVYVARPGQPTAAASVSQAQGSSVNSQDNDKGLQEEYRVIKDSVARVKLPKDFKISDTNKGIKRSEQPKAAILNNSAGYSETLLKLLLSVDSDTPIGEEKINSMLTVTLAQLRYIQEEKSMLLVNSSLGEGVGRLYRQFRDNTTMFSSGDIRTMESCVSLFNATQAASA